jgi:hypothetical protein
MATEVQIRALANAIQEQDDFPDGRGEECYYRAKQILEEQ